MQAGARTGSGGTVGRSFAMLRLGGHDSVLVPCPAVFAGYMPKKTSCDSPFQS